MRISRGLYLPAAEGIAVYAQNPSYTSTSGESLVESVKHEALAFDADGGRRYYHPRIFRRRSDDNGRTWTEEPDQSQEDPSALDGEHRNVSVHFLDPHTDRLLAYHCTYESDTTQGMFVASNRRQRTYRTWYEVSSDGGRTWSPPTQLVDCREGYDATHWAPGIVFGENGAVADLSAPVFLDDGSFVLGLTVSGVTGPSSGDDDEGRWGVIYARGRWNADGQALAVVFGDLIRVPPTVASGGCCEPAATSLSGGRLLNTMRCQGSDKVALFSSRQCTVSEDGGSTWGPPAPLRYDDGGEVYVPASYSTFLVSAKTGKTYMFGNILPTPVRAQTPRYPLAMAELDIDRGCVLRDTVEIIQDLPAGAPEERRYSNWGCYEERGSGDIIMTMPEQPKAANFSEMQDPAEFTADCVRWRVEL